MFNINSGPHQPYRLISPVSLQPSFTFPRTLRACPLTYFVCPCVLSCLALPYHVLPLVPPYPLCTGQYRRHKYSVCTYIHPLTHKIPTTPASAKPHPPTRSCSRPPYMFRYPSLTPSLPLCMYILRTHSASGRRRGKTHHHHGWLVCAYLLGPSNDAAEKHRFFPPGSVGGAYFFCVCVCVCHCPVGFSPLVITK